MNNTPNDDDCEEEDIGFIPDGVSFVLVNTKLQSGPAKNVDSGMMDESHPTVYPSKPLEDWKYNGRNCGNIAAWNEYNQYNTQELSTIIIDIVMGIKRDAAPVDLAGRGRLMDRWFG